MVEFSQNQGQRFGQRLFGGRGVPPARGNLGPSYSVDQKYDKRLEGSSMSRRLEELKKFSTKPRDLKSKVAPYGQQLLGIAFNQRTSKQLRLASLSLVVKLGRKHAAPAEQDLPRLAKDKDPEIAAAAMKAIKEFKKQPQAQAPQFPRFGPRR